MQPASTTAPQGRAAPESQRPLRSTHDLRDAVTAVQTPVAEIDPEFLAALPEELRAEIQATYPAHREAEEAQEQRNVDQGAPQMEAGNPSAAADVQPQAQGDLDPEFLSALPPDLQAEVLAQQREMQRVENALHAQQAAAVSGAERTGTEMDMASILATFPADVRAEALLTLDDGTMNALPPNLLSEAIQIRQRAASVRRPTPQDQDQVVVPPAGAAAGGNGGDNNRLHTTDQIPSGAHLQYIASSHLGNERGLHAGMIERVEALVNRLPSNMGASLPGGLSRIRSRDVPTWFFHQDGSLGEREGATGAKALKDVDIPAQVDSEGLVALLRLVQLAPPLAKGFLPRVMVNLCLNSKVALDLVQIISSMLKSCIDADYVSTLKLANRLLPEPQMDLARMYGCQANVVYAKSASDTSLPPLVSRRLLDLLLHLSKHESKATVARLIVTHQFRKRLAAKSPKTGKSKRSRLDSETRELPVLQILLAFLASSACKSSNDHLDRTLMLLLTTFKCVHEQIGAEEAAAAAGEAGEAAGSLKGEAGNAVKGAQEGRKIRTSEKEESKAKTPEKDVSKRPGSASKRGQGSSAKRSLKADAESTMRAMPEQLLVHLVSLVGQPGHRDVIGDRAMDVLTYLCLVAPSRINLVLENLCRTALSLMQTAQADMATIGQGQSSLCAAPPSSVLILRVVECLHQIIGTYKKKSRGPLPKDVKDVISQLEDSMQPLWVCLGAAIKVVESDVSQADALSAMTPANAKLVPLVEAFAVLCSSKALLPEEPESNGDVSGASARPNEVSRRSSIGLPKISSPGGDQVKKDTSASLVTFFSFCEEHRGFVNAAIKRTPELLLGGAYRPTLAYLLMSPSLLDFENKRVYFRAKMKELIEVKHMPSLRLLVRREYVFEDSFQYMRKKSNEEMRGKLNIQFRGEEGIDAGGVTREWYQLMARRMFNENLALFTSSEGGSTFQPNPNSGVQSEDIGHLDYFRFTGRVVGKALMDGQLMDAYFTRSFYKHMLCEPLTVEDIEAVDPDYYKNLKWMLENDITGVLDLNFTAETDYFGKKEMVELKPGGAQCPVTEDNKAEYVKKVCEHRMTTAIKPQIEAFLEGFWQLVPRDLISLFNNTELELLISGLPDIDKGELRAHTDYTGYVPASPIIQWFWEVVDELNKEDMARLLQFCTGTSKVPLDGFKALQGISGPQKFQIHRAYGPLDRLPAAHTCFNQLDLIEYENKEQLREKLLLAIHEGSEGFGFG